MTDYRQVRMDKASSGSQGRSITKRKFIYRLAVYFFFSLIALQLAALGVYILAHDAVERESVWYLVSHIVFLSAMSTLGVIWLMQLLTRRQVRELPVARSTQQQIEDMSTLTNCDMAEALSQAIRHKQLSLQYQPQYSMRDKQLVTLEALLRWEHPRLGNVPPSVFIPIAEAYGLMPVIGVWVLQTACEQCANWYQQGIKNIRVAVNVSTEQLCDPTFSSLVEAILKRTGLPAKALELEVTESILIMNRGQIFKQMALLKRLGVSFSIDDFGTGYSGLSYLANLPFDRVKIDKSFVQGIDKEQDKAAIAGAIINISHQLNLDVVAEGVEGAQQYRVLQRQGCDVVQGYYLSYPLSATYCTTMMLSSAA